VSDYSYGEFLRWLLHTGMATIDEVRALTGAGERLAVEADYREVPPLAVRSLTRAEMAS
jgi:hypothetical protein